MALNLDDLSRGRMLEWKATADRRLKSLTAWKLAAKEKRWRLVLCTEAAASRLELLRDAEHEFENLGNCLICHSFDKMGDKLWHADDCELAKELGDGAERKTGYGPNDWS